MIPTCGEEWWNNASFDSGCWYTLIRYACRSRSTAFRSLLWTAIIFFLAAQHWQRMLKPDRLCPRTIVY
jgi:hypothetical protein